MKVFRLKCVLLIFCVPVLLAGCPVSRVTYERLNKNPRGKYKYFLTKTLIKIDYDKDESRKKDKDKKEKTETRKRSERGGRGVLPPGELIDSARKSRKDKKPVVVATPVAVEDEARSMLIEGTREEWLVKTNLHVTYFEDTDRLKSLGTEIIDDRVKTIKEVASIVTGAIGLAALFAKGKEQEPLKLPVVLDVNASLPKCESNIDQCEDESDWKLVPGHREWSYKIKGEKPQGASLTEAFFPFFREKRGPQSKKVLAYSACSYLVLSVVNRSPDALENMDGKKIQEAERNGYVFRLRYADSRYVQTIRLPAKGTVSMHPVCGVDVKEGKAEVTSPLKLVGEIMNEVKSIKEAVDKFKEKKK